MLSRQELIYTNLNDLNVTAFKQVIQGFLLLRKSTSFYPAYRQDCYNKLLLSLCFLPN